MNENMRLCLCLFLLRKLFIVTLTNLFQVVVSLLKIQFPKLAQRGLNEIFDQIQVQKKCKKTLDGFVAFQERAYVRRPWGSEYQTSPLFKWLLLGSYAPRFTVLHRSGTFTFSLTQPILFPFLRHLWCFILSTLKRWDKSAAIQELFSFLGIGTKQLQCVWLTIGADFKWCLKSRSKYLQSGPKF